MSCKKLALENFGKFTAKHMCWSLFINKVTGVLQLSLNRGSATGVSLREFYETFKSNFFKNTPGQLFSNTN